MESRELSRGGFIKNMALVGAGSLAAGGLLSGCAPKDASAGSKTSVSTANGEAASSSQGFTMKGFSDWALAGGNSGAAGGGFFLSGDENKPTDDDIDQILQTANTYFACNGLTGTHFVVVKDTAEQKNLLGHMNVTGEGTVTVLVMADGLKAQEYHQEQYFPGLPSENGGNPMYWQTYYGIFEAGWATGYLNLAARELGYRMRTFGSLNIVNVVIGKIDESDAVSGATMSMDYKEKIRSNYDIWG